MKNCLETFFQTSLTSFKQIGFFFSKDGGRARMLLPLTITSFVTKEVSKCCFSMLTFHAC